MENINNEKKYQNSQKYDNNIKEENKNVIYFREPEWIALGRLKMTADGSIVSDETLHIPENLAEDILNNIIDPEKYTKEQLRMMSIKRQLEQKLQDELVNESSNIEEKYKDKTFFNDDSKKR